jgi:hypothetical protein
MLPGGSGIGLPGREESPVWAETTAVEINNTVRISLRLKIIFLNKLRAGFR